MWILKDGGKMKRNIYASIEFGSHSIKLLVSEFYKEKQNILFIDEIFCKGIKAGIIVDKTLIYNDAKKLIAKCEDFLSINIKSVALMLPSVELATKEVSYDITIPENKVKGQHIKNLFNKIYTEEANETDSIREIAYIYPNSFTSLKTNKIVDNPVGEITRQLFVSLEIVYENKKMIIDYISVIEQLGIEVIEIMPNVVGYKKSLLTPDEITDYTCVINVGAQTTTITVFNDQLINRSDSYKIGTKMVTEAIQERFNLSYEDAEDFKITHGNCLVKEATDEIVFEERFADGSITYITNEYLAKIIEGKYLEIIRIIRRYLFETGLKNKINKYILIGGGVAIEGFKKLFKNNFGENVTIRTPNLVGTRHPKYSSIISGQYNILYLERLFEVKYQMVSFNNSKI